MTETTVRTLPMNQARHDREVLLHAEDWGTVDAADPAIRGRVLATMQLHAENVEENRQRRMLRLVNDVEEWGDDSFALASLLRVVKNDAARVAAWDCYGYVHLAPEDGEIRNLDVLWAQLLEAGSRLDSVFEALGELPWPSGDDDPAPDFLALVRGMYELNAYEDELFEIKG